MISHSFYSTLAEYWSEEGAPYFIDEEIEAHIDDTDLAEQKLWWE